MRAFPSGSDGKESACSSGDPGSIPGSWVRKIPWRREWLPTPVFLPGEFRGQRSLEGYSPWRHKELDVTERLTLSLYFSLLIDTQVSFYMLWSVFSRAYTDTYLQNIFNGPGIIMWGQGSGYADSSSCPRAAYTLLRE